MLSYTLNYQPWVADLEVPYVVAIIELVEQQGLRFVSNVIGMDPLQVRIDMLVRVSFLHIEDVWLPLFEKDQ
ncbi:hypothetical protein PCLA_09f0049 [Pseudomonas citronellolis]|nr:hypothetical protein PCLA_09f0049 [Pseudomonas citronellolis]